MGACPRSPAPGHMTTSSVRVQEWSAFASSWLFITAFRRAAWWCIAVGDVPYPSDSLELQLFRERCTDSGRWGPRKQERAY
eukprot:413561-Rhodomonas_salina.1